MTREFMIRFNFHSESYQAKVLQYSANKGVDYAVRPKEPCLVRVYGRQSLIHRQNDRFFYKRTTDASVHEYLRAIVLALRNKELVDHRGEPESRSVTD